MKEKYQQFFNEHNGTFLEVNDPTNKYQCMDLAYGWCDYLGIPRDAIRHLYAYQVYTSPSQITKDHFGLITNSPEGVPEVGDLVVFSKLLGVAGHISISNGTGDTKSFESFDQNFGTPKSCRIVKHDYKAVLGWLRPKNKPTTNMPNWFDNFLQENNLTLNDEGKIREIFDKGKRYNDETNALKEQVKSANEALADRAREVSLLTETNQKLNDRVVEAEEGLNTTRAERDTTAWNAEKLEIQNKTLLEENEALKEKNPLMGYGWFTRLFSLFRR